MKRLRMVLSLSMTVFAVHCGGVDESTSTGGPSNARPEKSAANECPECVAYLQSMGFDDEFIGQMPAEEVLKYRRFEGFTTSDSFYEVIYDTETDREWFVEGTAKEFEQAKSDTTLRHASGNQTWKTSWLHLQFFTNREAERKYYLVAKATWQKNPVWKQKDVLAVGLDNNFAIEDDTMNAFINFYYGVIATGKDEYATRYITPSAKIGGVSMTFALPAIDPIRRPNSALTAYLGFSVKGRRSETSNASVSYSHAEMKLSANPQVSFVVGVPVPAVVVKPEKAFSEIAHITHWDVN